MSGPIVHTLMGDKWSPARSRGQLGHWQNTSPGPWRGPLPGSREGTLDRRPTGGVLKHRRAGVSIIARPRPLGPYDWFGSDGLDTSYSTIPAEPLDCDTCIKGARFPSEPLPVDDDIASTVVSESEVNEVPDIVARQSGQ